MTDLTVSNLEKINKEGITTPLSSTFKLPNKVLQFGTGALLRGLPDYFIDKANRNGIFNGRIVAIKSTLKGPIEEFEKQNCLYTLAIRGIDKQEYVQENMICSPVSEMLQASVKWKNILLYARDPGIKIIISNTTEIGMNYVEEKISNVPPKSFPGKLLAFLYERFVKISKREQSPLIIIPTELVPDNGRKLEQMIIRLAIYNKLGSQFIEWVSRETRFCNSLVDRIVPGKPTDEFLTAYGSQYGYRDKLLIVAESYALWAIEGDESIASVLSFSRADKRVIIKKDIRLYHDIKLSLLNAVHTLSCGISILSGIKTVKGSMDNAILGEYIETLMFKEIIPSMPDSIGKKEAFDFAQNTLDRFRNPYISHYWHDITKEFTTKVRTRVVPILVRYYDLFHSLPGRISFGFAAYLFFMATIRKGTAGFFNDFNGASCLITDGHADYFFEVGKKYYPAMLILVREVLKSTDLWGQDLSALPGFSDLLYKDIKAIMENGVLRALVACTTNSAESA